MSNMHQLFLWGEPPRPEPLRKPACPSTSPTDPHPGMDAQHAPDRDERMVSDDTSLASLESLSDSPVLPRFTPLQSAIEAGIFGITAAGPMEPDEHEIAAMTQEHSNDLAGTLIEIGALEDAIRSGIDPRTGSMPRTSEAASNAAVRWREDLERMQANYANLLAAFAEGFGEQAASELDAWVRARVAGTPWRLPYDPGHPWHYYWAGDAAEPLAFEDIPPAEDAGRWLERDLPKNPAKRLARLRELLTSETQRLDEDRRRYEEIVARGAEALSRFDREIAYGGNDELARAGTIALKYNHIRMGLGRVRWLREQLDREKRWEPIHAAIAQDR